MTAIGLILFVLALQIALPALGGLVLSRRRDPAVACGPLMLAVGAILLFTPLAFVPRPEWRTSPLPSASIDESTSVDAFIPANESTTSGGVNVLDLLRLAQVPTESAPASFDWWSALAWAALGLAAIGVARFAIGWLAVTRAIRRSTRNSDAALLAMAESIRVELGCRRPIELRESDRVGSAATAGWRRPVILVSPAWRTWTSAELRAVLAHEIAHVARGDFASRLIARFALALHAWHPLVRWLTARLELCQELAADARAATACGGRPAYLKCLAALALKADRARPIGVMPTFLSRPRTLLRRIAMLRVTDDTARIRRWPAFLAVGLLAAGALALHGTIAQADPIVKVRAEEEIKRAPLDLTYVVPIDTKEVVGSYALRIGELMNTPGLEAFMGLYENVIPTAFGADKKVHFKLADIEQLCGRVSLRHEPEKPSPNRSMMSLSAVRMAKDFNWVKQLKEWATEWKEHVHGGSTYYSCKMSVPVLGFKDSTVWFYLPDARTVVLESDENIKKLIDAKGKPAAKPTGWSTVEDSLFAYSLTDPKGRLAKKLTPPPDLKDEGEKAIFAALADIFGRADSAVAGFRAGKACEFNVSVHCATPADANAIDQACQGLLKQAETQLAAVEKAGLKKAAKPELLLRHGVEGGQQVVGVTAKFPATIGELVKALMEMSEK